MSELICDQPDGSVPCTEPAVRLIRYDFGRGAGNVRPTCARHYKEAQEIAARFAAKGESDRMSIVSDEAV